MNDLRKKAKMQAIMDIMKQMDDLELDRLSPKESMMDDMEMEEMKPEKKLTVMKIEKSKPEMEIEIEPEMEEDENGMQEAKETDEEIDPSSSLARLRKRLGK